jgi:hypothetical protein
MPREKKRDYEVGYGKPPRENRFQKGQSGNPRGRPCGAKNLKTRVREALKEPVLVTENGRRRKVTKGEAIITQLVNRAANADLRAVKILLDLLRDIEAETEPSVTETSGFSDADEKVLEQLKARFPVAGGEQ